jgi:hypothetical protein
MTSNAKQMVEILEDCLRSNAGVKSISVDGQTIMLDRAQALVEMKYWQREVARQAGRRSPFRGIDIGSAW